MPDLLVVVHDVAQVVASAVVCFADGHAVMREVDVAVVAEKFGHRGGGLEREDAREMWFEARCRRDGVKVVCCRLSRFWRCRTAGYARAELASTLLAASIYYM